MKLESRGKPYRITKISGNGWKTKDAMHLQRLRACLIYFFENKYPGAENGPNDFRLLSAVFAARSLFKLDNRCPGAALIQRGL